MRKILVTGGAGFIAGCVVERLLQDPDNYVVIVDNMLTGSTKNLPSNSIEHLSNGGINWKYIQCDVNNINDISPIMISYSFDYVFHYAAVVGVQRTLDNPVMVLNDIEGIRNILHLSKNTGVKRIFFSSSSEVYGEPAEMPQNEFTTPLNSRLPYAVVKNVGESFCRSYSQEFGLDYTIFRFFNTYGPRQSTDFVMSKFIRLALANEPITVYGDGSQTRTFCYIDDHLDATLKAAGSNLFVNDVLNIGSDQEITILELAQKVISATKSSSDIIHLPPLPEGDMTRRKPDTSKMKLLLGRELTSIEVGIQKVVESGRF